ncbi:hypothetical protein [Kribbella jejuensis]|uniref:hypothetical protein n=1 Tax=Kribbella jejuensis TaxID=236068 RepID=UPI001EE16286|nr:hypothetical protein [Kribbella jejuensis]
MKSYPQLSQNSASADAGSEQFGHVWPGIGASGAPGVGPPGVPGVAGPGAGTAGVGSAAPAGVAAAPIGRPQTSQ